jgi:hypothetical protein
LGVIEGQTIYANLIEHFQELEKLWKKSAEYKADDKVAEYKWVEAHDRNFENHASGNLFTSKTMYFDCKASWSSLKRIGDRDKWVSAVKHMMCPYTMVATQKAGVNWFTIINNLRIAVTVNQGVDVAFGFFGPLHVCL